MQPFRGLSQVYYRHLSANLDSAKGSGLFLSLSPGHVDQDLVIDEPVGIDSPQVVQMVPVLIGDLIVVVDVGQPGDGAEDILLRKEKYDYET